ncbi:MAG: histidine kinase, partial [Sphingomicrobium sp.]
MSELSGTSLIATALAALWIVVAALIAFAAARRFRRANSVLASARSMARLLDAAPARPLLVYSDGRIETEPRLLRDIGLERVPTRLADLGGDDRGLDQADLDALIADIAAAAAVGGRVERTVRSAGSARVFDVRGGPAPPPEPPGTLLLWLFDTSVSEEERAKLSLRLHHTEGALDSLTHLIESAPFPMWFRGPDLKLGLVNSAFVEAVEARDAADVIERSIELIDETGDNGAKATAMTAIEAGKTQSHNQAAIIRGERRMLKIVNVPLPTGAVAGFAIDIQDLEDARFELARYMESQRELADRMTAGAAQFDADRSLNFFNQPFA